MILDPGGGRRRLVIALVVGLVVVLGAGAGVLVDRVRVGDCTAMGGSSGLSINVPQALRSRISTIRVRLKQDDRSAFTEFGPVGTNKYGAYIERGIFIDGDTYAVKMTDDLEKGPLDAQWREGEATVFIDGWGPNGDKVFRREETFTFDGFYPNGKSCDQTPYLRHDIGVTAADVVQD